MKCHKLCGSIWKVSTSKSSFLAEGDKATYAKYTFHAMPNYIGIGGDRLTLVEVGQLRNFWESVENGWPKKGLNSEKSEKEGL